MTDTLIEARREAQSLIARLAFKRGNFKLASGRQSQFYFNLKPVVYSVKGAKALGLLLAEKASALNANLVGGMETGALPLAAITLAFWPENVPEPAGFFIRKQAKAHGSQAQLEGIEPEQAAGKTAIILEDTTTTGGSALKAAALMRAAGSEVPAILTIVDRKEGAEEEAAKAGLSLISLFTPEDF